ncbi:hypothetical protein WICPIJ_004098 [Wickerhamomyces pijperi]|uniref:ENTH domain-containing protein n=1 Tax=Wickerhamomyces pijperi TaxID=599730 RepID=A0A9P8Q8C6_WICPI|nr:hypothetical protein WICPIJ_004098 [Wickerhamomyces pijperi]
MSRRWVRSIRNLSSSPEEIKIKEATSNDSFGPTATELNDIAVLSNSPKELKKICQVLNKRLLDTSKNWRHILKSLTVILYCIVAGSLEFVSWTKSNAYILKTLQEFQIRGNDDLAQQIRSKATKISTLLEDCNLLIEKRSKLHIFRNQMSQPATKQRSSLDINRSTDKLKLENLLPTNISSRGSYSLDLVRSDNIWDISKSPCEVVSNPILADISEE